MSKLIWIFLFPFFSLNNIIFRSTLFSLLIFFNSFYIFIKHFIYDTKFLTTWHHDYSQNTIISLRYDDFWPKIYLILSPSLRNLTTHIAIDYIHIPIIIKVQCVKHLIQIFIFFGMTIKLSGYICFCDAQWLPKLFLWSCEFWNIAKGTYDHL